MADPRCKFDSKIGEELYVFILFEFIPYLKLSVKFASQICHENINKTLDGAYLSDFGLDHQRSSYLGEAIYLVKFSFFHTALPENVTFISTYISTRVAHRAQFFCEKGE